MADTVFVVWVDQSYANYVSDPEAAFTTRQMAEAYIERHHTPKDCRVEQVPLDVGYRPGRSQGRSQVVFIDALRFVCEEGDYSGRSVRLLAHPPIADTFDIFLVADDGLDEHTVYMDESKPINFITKDRNRP